MTMIPTSPWMAPAGGTAGFAPMGPAQPWAPPQPSGGTNKKNLPGVRQGSGAVGYVQQRDGSTRPVMPGQQPKIGLGEAYITGAPPGTASRADQVRDAALADRKNAEAAQKRQQGRFDQAIAGFQSEIGRADADLKDNTGRVDQAMSKTAGDFSEAKQFWRDSVSKYEDRGAKDAAAAIAGSEANFRQAENDIKNDPNLPENVKAQRLHNLKMDMGKQVQQTVTGIYSNINSTLASLRQGAGEGLGKIASAEAASNQTYLGMREAATARAAQLRLEGRVQVANLLQKYPDSAFSMVDTLLQMSGADKIPNANQSGFRF